MVHDTALREFARTVGVDAAAAARLIDAHPELARAKAEQGATRQDPQSFWVEALACYVYAGDTALHLAAAAYRPDLVRRLVALGADVHAANRHGALPLHAASVGSPGTERWNPQAQAATIGCLIEAGADPNAADKRGVTALHRAVRTRSAAAVAALLAGGAEPRRRNRNGSTPMKLTHHNTGRSGSGSREAKAQQQEIARLLAPYGSPT